MSKITLTNVGSITQNPTSAQANINSNFATIQTAFDNTFSRDGTAPNPLENTLDANSFQIINLPVPATADSPVRLQDLSTVTGGGTVSNIPVGGNTGDALVKRSNADYDIKWSADSSTVAAGTNISVTGTSPATISTTNNPTFSTSVTTPSIILNGNTFSASAGTTSFGTGGTVAYTGNPLSQFANTTSSQLAGVISDETGTGSLVFNTSPTLITPALGTPASGVLTNCTGTAAGLTAGSATTATTASTANAVAAANITGTTLASGVVTSSLTSFGASPTITTPNITGTIAGGNATAGSVGEYMESDIPNGSSISVTSGAAKTLTSITLTAGDWDVTGMVSFLPGATTTWTQIVGSLSGTTNALDQTVGRFVQLSLSSQSPSGGISALSIMPCRFNVTTSTTIFLIAFSTFATSTMTAYGHIRARRIR